MPSFLSKFFRKKKEPDEGSASASKGSSKKSRKSASKKLKGSKADKAKAALSAAADLKKSLPPQEPPRTTGPSNGASNLGISVNNNSSGAKETRVLSPRNQIMPNPMEPIQNEASAASFTRSSHQQVKQQTIAVSHAVNHSVWSAGPVDLDESDLGSDTDENVQNSRNQQNGHGNPAQLQRLSVQQLHRFDMQQQKRDAGRQFYMPQEDSARFSAGHVPVVDDMNRSDASSSSFNLSTDAEDTEYEALKKRGVLPNPTVLDSSHLSGVSSPTNYNTDGDNSIFPALQTDDEGTLNERDSQTDGSLPVKAPATEQEDANGSGRGKFHVSGIQKQQLSRLSRSEDEEDRAWVISPTKHGSNHFPFYNPASPTPRRNLTSPKMPMPRHSNSFNAPVAASTQNDTSVEFANFADFSNVTFPADTESWGAPKTNNSKVLVDGSPPLSPGRKTQRSSHSVADMTLSDILAQAKGKRSIPGGSQRSTGSSGNRRRVSSSSVNSAPAITSKYLRQHHNLKPVRHASDHDGTTPVSDIIDSLEIANASRSGLGMVGGSIKSTSRSSFTHEPSHAVKERLEERRRRSEKDYATSRRRSSDPNHESSDGSDQEASESWLFDEVTGALGPRGIAADLESLSGRSKSSSGNKSHKSHRSHRSHRSHGRSSHRRKSSSKSHHHPSSGESVDSRGSRHSRGSRYSHRSTRSYLSQMSEQSRSVANDLLRLEMQLAMVGSQDNNAAAAAVAGSSASVASRASRKSRSSARRTVAIARRNKVTIQAPPGKLGIILANKADSKGTVVSGVRSSSVLSEKISPGDRIVAIDGEDVSLMTVSEITTIMARKSDFERTLTVLTTPKHLTMHSGSSNAQPPVHDRTGGTSPTKALKDFDSYQNRYSSSGR